MNSYSGRSLKFPLVIAGIIVLSVIIYTMVLWIKPVQNAGDTLQKESSQASDLTAHFSEADKRMMGLIGPFPIGDEIPPRSREIGVIMNAWREAVALKNIKLIEQLDLKIKGYGQEAVPFLRKSVLEDKDERIRAFAARILGRMRSSQLYDLFIDLLQKDTSELVRGNAAWSLQNLGDVRAVPILQAVAQTDKSEKVRQKARSAVTTLESIKQNK